VLLPHLIPNDHHDTNFVRIIIGATGFRIACAIRHVESFRTHISLIFWVSGQEMIQRLFPYKK
jgi:hypothetical protein